MTEKIQAINCQNGGSRAYGELMAGLGDTSKAGESVETYCRGCNHRFRGVIGADMPHSFQGTKAICPKKD